MVGLGVGIDYALFLVTRHREHLAAGLPVAESVGRALATAGQAVVFAGGTVVVAILGLAVAGLPFVTAGGRRHLRGRAGDGARRRSPCCRPCSGWPGIARINRRCAGSTARGATTADAAALRCRLGCPRLAARRGVRRRRHGPAARAGRARPRAAARLPRRGHATRRRAPSGGPTTWSPTGFGPGANGPLVDRRRHLAGPVGGGAAGLGPRQPTRASRRSQPPRGCDVRTSP